MQTAESAEEVVDQEVIEDAEQEEIQHDDQEGEEGGESGQQTPEDDAEIEITLGNVAAPATEEDESAPDWVKNLRRENREQARRIKELEKQSPTAEPAVPKLGPRPTLADHDFDEDAYNAALDRWYADKKSADDHEADRRRKADEAKQEQQKVLTTYQQAATKLRVPDFKEAEETVVGSLSEAQQGIILNGAEDPAKLVYVLGKYPEELKKLASIANPVKFAFAVAKLEKDVKVTQRTKPAPEGTVSGGSAPRTGGNAALERLRAEAEKTGDYTKVLDYKRQMRAKK